MHAPPYRGTKKRLAKVRLQKSLALQTSLSDYGLQWKPLVLSSPPCQPFQWTPVHTFSGNGSQKTETFKVGEHWRIVWNCDPSAVERPGYVVIIQMEALDGRSGESGVKAVCEENTTYAVNELYGEGQVCLHIISGGEWTAQVQEWKQAASSDT